MSLIDDVVVLIERAYPLVQRYEETRDAALVDDSVQCTTWLLEAQQVLARARANAAAGPKPEVDPLERIADALESLVGQTKDGDAFLRVVTGMHTAS